MHYHEPSVVTIYDAQSNSWSRVAAGTLWEADDAAAKYVVKVFYENMFKDLKDGCFMDCTKAAWAHAVKTKALIEQRMFIHIGMWFLLYCFYLERFHRFFIFHSLSSPLNFESYELPSVMYSYVISLRVCFRSNTVHRPVPALPQHAQ